MIIKKFRYVHRGVEPLLNIIIYFILLLEFGFFYVFSFPKEFYRWNSETSKYLLVGTTLCGLLLVVLIHGWSHCIKKFTFLKWYAILMLLMIFMMNLSAYIQYQVPIRDLFITSIYHYFIFFAWLLIIKFAKDNSISCFFSVCNIFFFIWLTICIIENISYKFYGIHIVKHFLPDWFTRNGFVRMRFISVCYLLIPYNFYKLISLKERKYLSIYAITVIAMMVQLFIEGTRTYSIIILGSLISIFLSDTTRTRRNRGIIMAFLAIVGLCIVNTSQFRSFIFSFSLSSENRYIYSSINRINEVVYYMKKFLANPILAMGNVPYAGAYGAIIKGPEGKFYLEDVGFIGLLAKSGISAVLFYFTLIFRQIYILLKIGTKNKYFPLLMGFFTFNFLSSITLIVTDMQRIFLLPILIATFEYVYIRHKENNL